jgi:hypothetical protein
MTVLKDAQQLLDKLKVALASMGFGFTISRLKAKDSLLLCPVRMPTRRMTRQQERQCWGRSR